MILSKAAPTRWTLLCRLHHLAFRLLCRLALPDSLAPAGHQER